MGWRNQPTTMLFFEDCKIPASNLLAKPGEGFKIAMKALDGGRLNIASCGLGGAAFALETSREYVKNRKQFGKKLADFQNIQFKLADMVTDLSASRYMVRNAARMYDMDHPQKSMNAAMAKMFATDKSFDIINYCLQMHGGYGYLADYPLERLLRDSRVLQILEGTNEIMKLIISRNLLKE
jgi:alkylation response protein AidB-like acyl-CoA dehydrogenase